MAASQRSQAGRAFAPLSVYCQAGARPGAHGGGNGEGRCRESCGRRITGYRQSSQQGGAMNDLHRNLAPMSGAAWAQIDTEAKRTLKTMLAARKLVDFSG